MNDERYSFRVLWNTEDEGYVAVCPEFPGVSGFGVTESAAVAEARAALSVALEEYEASGMAIPKPETMAGYSGQFRLRIPAFLHERLVVAAADQSVSLNTYAASLLAMGMGDAEARQELRRELSQLLSEFRSEVVGGVFVDPAVVASSTDLMHRTGQWIVAPRTTGAQSWQH